MYTDLMIDIETLGNRPGCMIFSIGAVAFTKEGETCPNVFHVDISFSSQLGKLHIDTDAMDWWISEDPTKFLDYMKSSPHQKHMSVALDGLAHYIDMHMEPEYSPWSRGSKFDLPILEYAIDTYCSDIELPQRNERCVRTYCAIKTELVEYSIDKHNPIEDCKAQIKSVQNIYKWLNSKG